MTYCGATHILLFSLGFTSCWPLVYLLWTFIVSSSISLWYALSKYRDSLHSHLLIFMIPHLMSLSPAPSLINGVSEERQEIGEPPFLPTAWHVNTYTNLKNGFYVCVACDSPRVGGGVESVSAQSTRENIWSHTEREKKRELERKKAAKEAETKHREKVL